MAKEFIVAIELGSSKMTGIAGQKNLDGSITVLATVQENAESCIRKGVVYNIDKTGQCLTHIITKLKNILKADIAQVYVGVGGQSIRSMKNVIVKDLVTDTIVSQEMIDELMDTNRNMSYPDQEILHAATQEYKVDYQYQADPVGIQCSRLEGNFLNILWRKNFYRNLNTCFDNAGIAIAEMYLAPLALADIVLTDAEKRSGCILVDLGAETTTVSVYYKNILRHLAVIPLGGNNITKDITSLQMDELDAEKMKLKYAYAYTDNSAIDETLTYSIDKDRKIDSKTFIEIIEGRVQEIVENVWFQVPNEYSGKLLGGLILTGGGANMPNIEKAFRTFNNHIQIEKIRIAKFVNTTIHSTDPLITEKDGRLNTVLGLLAKGDMNCAGDEIRNDLFSGIDQKPVNANNTDNRNTRNINETITTGIVPTAAEKKQAEEDARKKKEAEDEAKRIAEEEEAKRIAEEKRKNSFTHKAMNNIKGFFKKMIEPEDE